MQGCMHDCTHHHTQKDFAPVPLTVMVGMREWCAYSSLRRFTRSIQMPRTCQGHGRVHAHQRLAAAGACLLPGRADASGQAEQPVPSRAAAQQRAQRQRERTRLQDWARPPACAGSTRPTFIRAVSRCLDCSGLLMMTATWCVSSPCRRRPSSMHSPNLSGWVPTRLGPADVQPGAVTAGGGGWHATGCSRAGRAPHVRPQVVVHSVGKLAPHEVVQRDVDVQGGAPHELVAHPAARAAQRGGQPRLRGGGGQGRRGWCQGAGRGLGRKRAAGKMGKQHRAGTACVMDERGARTCNNRRC